MDTSLRNSHISGQISLDFLAFFNVFSAAHHYQYTNRVITLINQLGIWTLSHNEPPPSPIKQPITGFLGQKIIRTFLGCLENKYDLYNLFISRRNVVVGAAVYMAYAGAFHQSDKT